MSDGNFSIVGIGASAGGLEALEQVFNNVLKGIGIAFVLIQQLDPNRAGIMVELLQRTTFLEVLEVRDRVKVKPDCISVIPPNKSLSIFGQAIESDKEVIIRNVKLTNEELQSTNKDIAI